MLFLECKQLLLASHDTIWINAAEVSSFDMSQRGDGTIIEMANGNHITVAAWPEDVKKALVFAVHDPAYTRVLVVPSNLVTKDA